VCVCICTLVCEVVYNLINFGIQGSFYF
jgi:hypothetical protein